MDKGNGAAVAALEARNWRVDFNENGGTFLEWYSPAGEDYCIESESNDLLWIFEREYEFFDVDEHVDLWAESRGKRGVPDSYVVLLDDAKAIEKELEECEREVRNALSLQGK